MLVLDLAGGATSLGELDVLRGCRDRGLPAPDQQVLRRTASGSVYLDFRWDRFGVVLEVDGIQHTWVEHVVGDAVRQNRIALDGDLVLRLPVLGLRIAPDLFFDQVQEALRRGGWGTDAAASPGRRSARWDVIRACRPRWDVIRAGRRGGTSYVPVALATRSYDVRTPRTQPPWDVMRAGSPGHQVV